MEKETGKNLNKIFEKNQISDMHFYWINFSVYDFSWINFINCKFEKCNLSNIALNSTTFNNIDFINSKIMWLKFVDINHFLSNFNFYDCNISLSSFYGLNLKNISFEDSEIKETDFTNTNLENSNFNYCNLEKSIFSNTNLKNTNFIWSYNFTIDPNLNKLVKTKFSRENCIGLLNYLDIIID